MSGTAVHGVLVLDKAAGLSSQAAVSRVRRALGAAKAGHCGTLDPMATGVLPILLGRATIFSDYFLEKDKRYLAEVRLGVETDTYDLTGTVVRTAAVPALSDGALEEALLPFRGEILQRPPLYRALKRGGRKLCDVARAGGTVEIEPRPVTVYALECVRRTADTLTLSVHCGKGTYIRSLAHDLGAALGCGAALAALRRTAAGPFEEGMALPEAAVRREAVLPVDECLRNFPRLECESYYLRLVKNGLAVAQRKLGVELAPGETARLYEKGRFLGLCAGLLSEGEPALKLTRHYGVAEVEG